MLKKSILCSVFAASLIAPVADCFAQRIPSGRVVNKTVNSKSSSIKKENKVFPSAVTKSVTPSTDQSLYQYVSSLSEKPADWICNENLPNKFEDANGYTWERTKGSTKVSVPSEIKLAGPTNIFPGAIIKYDFKQRIKDIQDGRASTDHKFSIVSEQRTPVTLTADIFGTKSQQVDASPTGEHNFLTSVLSQFGNGQSLSANIQVDIHEVKSSESYNGSIGVSAGAVGAKLNANFNKSTQSEKNIFFMELRQVYFSVKVNPLPGGINVCKNFGQGVTAASLKSSNSSNLPYAYVDRVDYGRVIYAIIETEKSSKSTAKSLEASYKDYFSGSASEESKKAVENSKLNLFFYGDQTNTLKTYGITTAEGLKSIMNEGITLKEKMEPKAVSFSLSFLNSGDPAGIKGSIPTWEEKIVSTPQKQDLVVSLTNASDYNTKWYVYYASGKAKEQAKWNVDDWKNKASQYQNKDGVYYKSFGDYSGNGACNKWKKKGWSDRVNVGVDTKTVYIHCRYKKGCDGNWSGIDLLKADVSSIEDLHVEFDGIRLKAK